VRRSGSGSSFGRLALDACPTSNPKNVPDPFIAVWVRVSRSEADPWSVRLVLTRGGGFQPPPLFPAAGSHRHTRLVGATWTDHSWRNSQLRVHRVTVHFAARRPPSRATLPPWTRRQRTEPAIGNGAGRKSSPRRGSPSKVAFTSTNKGVLRRDGIKTMRLDPTARSVTDALTGVRSSNTSVSLHLLGSKFR